MSNGTPPVDCSVSTCGFGAFGDVACTNGESCSRALMLDLNESPFHDAALVKASQEIQAILDTVQPDAYGRQLSFLHTQMGTVLAWVRHDIEVPADAVRAASPNDEVIKALGIRTQQAAA